MVPTTGSQAHGTHTRQWSLVFRQVKDLMEIALLGAMETTSVFVLAQASWGTGHVAPRGGRLQLPRGHPTLSAMPVWRGTGRHAHNLLPHTQLQTQSEQACVPRCGGAHSGETHSSPQHTQSRYCATGAQHRGRSGGHFRLRTGQRDRPPKATLKYQTVTARQCTASGHSGTRGLLHGHRTLSCPDSWPERRQQTHM